MRWNGSGRSSHRRPSKRLPGRPACACAPGRAATAATTSAHSLSALKSMRKKFPPWGAIACFCSRSSPPQAQKRRILACRVLYRSGAHGRIRTSTVRIRNPAHYPVVLRALFRSLLSAVPVTGAWGTYRACSSRFSVGCNDLICHPGVLFVGSGVAGGTRTRMYALCRRGRCRSGHRNMIG